MRLRSMQAVLGIMSSYRQAITQYESGPRELWGDSVLTVDGPFVRVYTIPKDVIIRLEKHGFITYQEEVSELDGNVWREWHLSTQGELYLDAKRKEEWP